MIAVIIIEGSTMGKHTESGELGRSRRGRPQKYTAETAKERNASAARAYRARKAAERKAAPTQDDERLYSSIIDLSALAPWKRKTWRGRLR
jgi:hypothetical protein